VRRGVLVGSIAVHAVIGAILYGLDLRAPAPPPRPPLDIEIVEIAPPERPVVAHRDAGGGSPGAVRAQVPAPPAPAVVPAPVPAPRSAPRRAAAQERPASNPGEGDGGEGTGLGGGRGGGIGLGAGPGLGELPALPALPAPPPPPPPPPPPVEKPPSKARPPKLVYPARDREGEESEMFVARLTIDHEGFVVGARVIRGGRGPRGELASQLVWRFRYAPALDDEGRAIRTTIEQRFLVGH
jgi:hypothetical protein